jgi:hypothetical protein
VLPTLADVHGKPTPSHAEILAADQNRVESIQRRASAPVQPGTKKKPVRALDALLQRSSPSLHAGVIGARAGHWQVATAW